MTARTTDIDYPKKVSNFFETIICPVCKSQLPINGWLSLKQLNEYSSINTCTNNCPMEYNVSVCWTLNSYNIVLGTESIQLNIDLNQYSIDYYHKNNEIYIYPMKCSLYIYPVNYSANSIVVSTDFLNFNEFDQKIFTDKVRMLLTFN